MTSVLMDSSSAAEFLQTVILVDDEARLSVVDLASDDDTPLSNVDAPQADAGTSVAEDADPQPGLQSPDVGATPSSSDRNGDLDAKAVIDQFSKLGLVCGVIRPEASDPVEETVGPAARRADILILDWWLNGDNGDLSLSIIRHVIGNVDERHRIRLIVIYTGERNLDGVASRVAAELGDSAKISDNRVESGPVYVTVLAKPETNVDSDLASAVVDYDALPERVIKEFAAAMHGLLPTVALRSFTAIRNNTHRVLNRFSQELDSAYLGHRMLLPYPEDAEDHVTSLVAQELTSVLSDASVGNGADMDAITALMDRPDLTVRLPPAIQTLAKEKGLADSAYALSVVRHGIEGLELGLSSNQKRDAYKWVNKVFAGEGDGRELELRFAALMKNKSRYEHPPPRLGLGVFLQDVRSFTYYLCMQPVCDSVRLKVTTAFPLLPLTEVDGGFDFVLSSDGGLRTFRTTMKLSDMRLFKFRPGPNPPGLVPGEPLESGEGWLFKTYRKDGAQFRWVDELREDWAHHYANKFAEECSRVGAEDSEWARRFK